MLLHRTVIKKEEKVEKKEGKKPEDIKKEEKDEDEQKPGTTNRSRVTKSGESKCSRGRASQGGLVGVLDQVFTESFVVPLLSFAAYRKLFKQQSLR